MKLNNHDMLQLQYPDLNQRIAEIRRSVGSDMELLAYMAGDRDKCLSERMLATEAMKG